MNRLAVIVSILVGVVFVATPAVIYARFHVFRGFSSVLLIVTGFCFFIAAYKINND